MTLLEQWTDGEYTETYVHNAAKLLLAVITHTSTTALTRHILNGEGADISIAENWDVIEWRKMRETKESTKELVDKMLSRDLHKMWEAGWGIHSLYQNPERVMELLPYKSQMEEVAKDISIDKSGEFALARYTSAKDALASAFKVLGAYEKGIGCPCQLLDMHSNPEQLEADGYMSILEVKYTGYSLPSHDYFIVKCNRCGQKFRVNEQEYHYTWWEWLPISEDGTDEKNDNA